MRALFIGRFQPFHNGHLELIKYVYKNYDFLIIGIGSSQYKNTKDNPFSYEERKEMIKRTLKKQDIKSYRIIDIPDIHNPPKWVDHVLKIVSDFDVVVTNNDFTKKLFEKKDFKVISTPLFNKNNYSGKNIREKIRNENNWKELVPEEVEEILLENDGVYRIKKYF